MSLNYLQYWSAVLAVPSAFHMHEEKNESACDFHPRFFLALQIKGGEFLIQWCEVAFLLNVKLSNLEKRQRCSVFMRKHNTVQ